MENVLFTFQIRFNKMHLIFINPYSFRYNTFSTQTKYFPLFIMTKFATFYIIKVIHLFTMKIMWIKHFLLKYYFSYQRIMMHKNYYALYININFEKFLYWYLSSILKLKCVRLLRNAAFSVDRKILINLGEMFVYIQYANKHSIFKEVLDVYFDLYDVVYF